MSSTDVKSVKLNRLVPDPENVNVHSEVNIAQIKASIDRFGFLDPIGVVPIPERRGYYMIVEGHGRHQAAQEIGLDAVPCLVLSLDEAQRKGYAIAHNQIQQLSQMDQQAVADEFARLEVASDDYLSLGFSEEDVLFMPASEARPHGEPPLTGDVVLPGDAADPPPAPEAGGSTGFMPVVHRTSLNFATEQSYHRFVHILAQLRDQYPIAGTIGERVILLLKDIGAVREPEAEA